MIVLSICVGIFIFQCYVECAMIANNTFTITGTSPLNDGLWTAVATCDTYVTVAYTANSAWMVSRFGVPITNYQDYLGGGSFVSDPLGKWTSSRIGYGSSGGSVSYVIQFNYDLWLGSAVPSADCHIFTDETEAINFAQNAPELSDVPADTLIATATFAIDSSGQYGYQGSCHFTFPGISVGARESMILVSFTVPVTYLQVRVGVSMFTFKKSVDC